MNLLYRHFKTIFFSALILSIAFAISCVEIGPVPKFEYTYDFEPNLEAPDTSSLEVGTIEITPGEVDNSGAEEFASDLSDADAAAAYATAVNNVLSTSQQTYWSNQSTFVLAAAIEGGDATTLNNIETAYSGFQNNSVLAPMLPALTGAVGSTGRIATGRAGVSLSSFPEVTLATAATQQQELDECKQAAEDAFQDAKTVVDSLYAVYTNLIESTFEDKFPQIAAQEDGLVDAAEDRHDARVETYESLFSSINTSVTTLFNNSEITAEERDLLNIANTLTYAIYHKASKETYDSELELIESLLQQTEDNLIAAREALETTLENNYNTEIARLARLRDSSQNACHNQGGVNSN